MNSIRRLLIQTTSVLTLLVITIPHAHAYEWVPEFQSLTEDEEARLDLPPRLNPEYESDILTYMRPLSWEYPFLTHPYAFDLSAGSIGAKHFMIEDRLKLRKHLTEFLEFRFTAFEERNFERDSSHKVLEFIVWPRKWVGFGFYGEPQHNKRNDDTGLAFFLKPNDRHEIRFFNTFVDVTRLRRSDRNDTYVEPYLPYSRGVVGRWWSEPKGTAGDDPESQTGDFFEYAFRYETKTRWIFPDQGYLYEYWKGFGSLFLGKELRPDLTLFVRTQFDRQLESKNPDSSSSTYPGESVRRDRFFFLTRLNFRRIGPNQNWELTPGVEYAYRHWQLNPGPAIHRDILPHLWLRMPAFGSGATRDFWEIGLDTQWHRAIGSRVNFDRDDLDGQVNGRLNLVYEFMFRKQASIRLLASADLDELGTKESWEGGNGMIRIYF